MIKTIILDGYFLTEASGDAKLLFDKAQFGEAIKNGQIKLSSVEALYLAWADKIEVFVGKKLLTFEDLLKNVAKKEKNILPRFYVYKDLRERGYIVKTALKFGADFRVYDKGVRMGEDHSKWIVFPVREVDAFSWQEFSSKNRVAHSTKKHLMLGIVDDEGDVTYYEVKWMRP